jgi:predicted small secreted protein
MMASVKSLLIVLILSTLVTGCATNRMAGWFGKSETVSLSKKEFSSLKKKTMAHWNKREDKAQLLKALEGFETLSKATNDKLEFYVFLSRGYYFLADGHTEDMEEKKKLWEKGTGWGEKAMATNKAFGEAMKKEEKVEDHLDKLGKKEAPAIYWTAVNLGKWAKNSGLATILKYKSRIKKMINKVQKHDAYYFSGSPYRYWGAYYAVAPSFAGGDMKKSKKNFDKVIKMFPNYLGSKVLYAEFYTTKKGNQKEYVKVLNEVLKAKLKKDSFYPENVIEKRKAKKLLEMTEDNF